MTRYLNLDNIVLIGAGTLGSSLSMILFKKLNFYRLLIVDPDKIEEKNVGNQWYSQERVGVYKVKELKNLLSTVHKIKKEKIKTHPVHFQTLNPTLWKNASLIIDVTDSLDVAKYLFLQKYKNRVLFAKIRENDAIAYYGDVTLLNKIIGSKEEHSQYKNIRTSWENSIMFASWITKNIKAMQPDQLYLINIYDELRVHKVLIK